VTYADGTIQLGMPDGVTLEYSIESLTCTSSGALAWWWLACRVLLKIVYLLACRVLGRAVLVFRGDRAKDAELLVLRHENAVLRRYAKQVRYELVHCAGAACTV